MKQMSLQQYVKSSEICVEDSEALLRILQEKNEELEQFNIFECDKVEQVFNVLERVLREEKKNIIDGIKESVRQSLSQVEAMSAHLRHLHEEQYILRHDIITNFNEIVQTMEEQPFQDILSLYNGKLQELDLFTKKTCQVVNIELISVDLLGQNTTTNMQTKWESLFKQAFLTKILSLRSSYLNLMKDNQILKLHKHISNPHNFQFIPPTSSKSSSQFFTNQKDLLLTSSTNQKSNNSLNLSQLNMFNNNVPQSKNNLQGTSTNSQLNHKNTTLGSASHFSYSSSQSNHSNSSLHSKRSNRSYSNGIPPQNSSLLFTTTTTPPVSKNVSLAQKIKNQKEKTLNSNSHMRTNSVYTNILKNTSKNTLTIDANKQLDNQCFDTRQPLSTNNATSSNNSLSFQPRNPSNSNAIKFR